MRDEGQGVGARQAHMAAWTGELGSWGVGELTYQTCSLILFPSISTVRILKSIPGAKGVRTGDYVYTYSHM